MRAQRAGRSVAMLALVWSLAAARLEASEAPADTVLLAGHVLTLDAAGRVVEAMALRAGRIVALGTDEQLASWIGPHTQVYRLDGATVTPGLIDAHCHLAMGAAAARFSLDLSYPAVKSIEDIALSVRQAVAGTPAGDWIRGDGWDEGKLTERRVMMAADLDAVSPDNPAWLEHTMGHYGTANSRALALAGIDRHTPDPPAGIIDRAPDGTPTGLLRESAMGLVVGRIPALRVEQRAEAIARTMAAMSREGMTAIKDPGIDRETWQAYERVRDEGKQSVRVFALWSSGDTLEDAQRLVRELRDAGQDRRAGDGWLVSGGVKMFMDGSGGARTAWVHDEWNRDVTAIDAGNRGYPAIDPDIFRAQYHAYHEAGLHVGAHAVGDRAIDTVVDTMASALEKTPTRGLRHSVIHCNVPTAHAIETLARLQKEYDAGYPEPSATFMWWIGDTYAGNWGAERSRRLNPFRTYQQKGIRWAGASDFSVTPFPARYGIWASVARQPLLGVYGGDPYGRDEAIDARTALRSYTSWAAPQIFMEDRVGTLEVGKLADIAVWDRDPETVTPDELKEMKCLLTFVEGRLVHRDEQAPTPGARP